MAGVQFAGGKFKGATEAKAQFRHNDKEQRLLCGKHANEQINLDHTSRNTDIRGLSYREICEAYDRRINELDSTTNANKRKDRTTLLSLNVVAPEGLPDEKVDAWYRRVWEITGDMYGQGNLLDCKIHRDEIHEYIDPDTRETRTSRVHGHMMLIPEHDGQLNGKWCASRSNIMKMNNAVHDMSVREFGVEFMTGSRKKNGKTVEQMKRDSAKALQEDREAFEHDRAALAAERADLQVQIKAHGEAAARYDEAAESMTQRAAESIEVDPMSEYVQTAKRLRIKRPDGSVVSYDEMIRADMEKQRQDRERAAERDARARKSYIELKAKEGQQRPSEAPEAAPEESVQETRTPSLADKLRSSIRARQEELEQHRPPQRPPSRQISYEMQRVLDAADQAKKEQQQGKSAGDDWL